MLVELLRTETQDGLTLDGALSRPASGAARSLEVDAVLCLHGVGGNFFGGRLFSALLPRYLAHGVAVARVNTRGYGLINTIATRQGAVRQGAALEIVDHCRYDVAAWVACLVARGMSRIALWGHSLGAIKAVYSQIDQPSEHVVAVVAASPPRLSYQAFLQDKFRDDFVRTLSRAQQLVEAGETDELLSTTFPVPLLISAASYVDKYGPSERYNFLKSVDRIAVPTLFVYGEVELASGRAAFDGLPNEILDRRRAGSDVDVSIISGADHFYNGCTDHLIAETLAWLTARFSPKAAS